MPVYLAISIKLALLRYFVSEAIIIPGSFLPSAPTQASRLVYWKYQVLKVIFQRLITRCIWPHEHIRLKAFCRTQLPVGPMNKLDLKPSLEQCCRRGHSRLNNFRTWYFRDKGHKARDGEEGRMDPGIIMIFDVRIHFSGSVLDIHDKLP